MRNAFNPLNKCNLLITGKIRAMRETVNSAKLVKAIETLESYLTAMNSAKLDILLQNRQWVANNHSPLIRDILPLLDNILSVRGISVNAA